MCRVAANQATPVVAEQNGAPVVMCEYRAKGGCNLAAHGAKQEYKRGTFLFRAGAATDNVFLIQRGVAQTLVQLGDGRRVILDFAFADDIVGFSAPGFHASSVQAVTKLTVASLRREKLVSLLHQHPAMLQCFLHKLTGALDAAKNLAVTLAKFSALQKTAFFLTELDRQPHLHDAAGSVIIPTDRLSIADHLGLTIETVSRMLHRLHRSKIIALEGHYKFRIIDRPAFDQLTRIPKGRNISRGNQLFGYHAESD